MTQQRRASDKRRRLVSAAREVIYREGYANTTLAKVSVESGVPLGNVYYYFRTKDDLAGAVIEGRYNELEGALAIASQAATPVDALVAFIDGNSTHGSQVSRYGCPYGTLVQELEKGRGEAAPGPGGAGQPPAVSARRLMERQLEWSSEQFRQLGVANPEERAEAFIGAMQGAALLAHALGNSGVMARRFEALKDWVRSEATSA